MNHLLVLTLALGFFGHFISVANGTCGIEASDDIINDLCKPGNHEEDIARLIFGCYLGAQRKDLILKCQRQIFGNTLGSKAHLDSFCNQIPQMADYNKCLYQAFLDNGLTINDMIADGNLINECQGDITGTCANRAKPTTTSIPPPSGRR